MKLVLNTHLALDNAMAKTLMLAETPGREPEWDLSILTILQLNKKFILTAYLQTLKM